MRLARRGVRGGRLIADGRVKPPGVVVGHPCADQMPGMAEIPEQVFVQAFIPQPPIESLAESILRWLAGCDVVPVESPVLNPREHSVRRELRSIVRNNHLRCAAPGDDVVEFADDPAARQRDICNGAEAFLGHVIDNVQHSRDILSA